MCTHASAMSFVCPLFLEGHYLLRSAESCNSPPVQIDKLFKKVILLRKCVHLPSKYLWIGYFSAATACDLRSARRFAFQFDLGIVNGEVNVSRTNGKVTIAIFSFFFSGGDFSLVPSKIGNSPRGKSPIGVKVGLER